MIIAVLISKKRTLYDLQKPRYDFWPVRRLQNMGVALVGVAQGEIFLLLAFFDNLTITDHLCKFSDFINNLQVDVHK